MNESKDYLSVEQMPSWFWEEENETANKINRLLDRFYKPEITEFPFIGEQLYAEEEGWA